MKCSIIHVAGGRQQPGPRVLRTTIPPCLQSCGNVQHGAHAPPRVCVLHHPRRIRP